MKKLYKATELADILRVDPQTIYRLGKQGKIESYKVGKSVRFVMPERERTEQNNDTERESYSVHQ